MAHTPTEETVVDHELIRAVIATITIESDDTGRFVIPLSELAERLGINKRTLDMYAREGRLPTLWIGDRRFVTPATIQHILNGDIDLATPKG